jgi:hypothetical protein
MREELCLEIPLPQVLITIPKILRLFFKFKPKLLRDLCCCAERTLLFYLEATAGPVEA